MSINNDLGDKIHRFEHSIMDRVAHNKEEMQREVEKFHEKEMQQFEDEILNEAYTKIQSQVSDLSSKTTKDISKVVVDYKKKILAERKMYVQDVFAKATEKLKEFTTTQEYKEFLIKTAKQFDKYENSIIFVAPHDMKYAQEIKQAYGCKCEIQQSDEFVIGGLILRNIECGILIDESLYNKLKDQREWFLQNSGLMVDYQF